ncbi:MAG: hypothetical protein RLZZ316_1454 [Bacteroidota bacterium]|jgi:hypothetical protein
MKKILIGGLVGGILLFVWQTVSWTVANLHDKGQQYTAKQDTLLSALAASGLTEGSYLVPRMENESDMAAMETWMKEQTGKPWAQISYYKAWEMNMGMNMARGLLSDIVIVCLLCWILAKISTSSAGFYILASVMIGVISFVNGPYTGHIWYPLHDIGAHLTDALVSWGLVGVWLAWWMRR